MHRRSVFVTLLALCVLSTFIFNCAEKKPEPSAENFQVPSVTLRVVDVAHYWGWWYYAKKIKPTMGKAGDYGAPLDLAFIYDINNPNPFPVLMDGFKFTVAFEEFDLNTVSL